MTEAEIMGLVAAEGQIQVGVDDPFMPLCKELCAQGKLDIFSDMAGHWTIYTASKATAVAEVAAELVEPAPKKARKPRAKREPGTAIVPAGEESVVLAEAKAWEDEARDLLAQLAEFKITNQIAMDLIGEQQRFAFEKRKAIEARRKFLKEPALEMGRRIDNTLKPAIGYWQSYEDACARLQSEARAEMRKAEDEALAKIEAAGGKLVDPEALVVAHGGVRLELPETSRETVSYTWTVIDAAALPEWCFRRVLDTEKIEAFVQIHQMKAPEQVPGLKVERVVDVGNKAVRK